MMPLISTLLPSSMTTSNSDLLAIGLGVALIFLVLLSFVKRRARMAAKTPLRGPPSMNWVFGCSRYIMQSPDASIVYGDWAKEYGDVFEVPTFGGNSKIILCDPKAISHFYAHETTTYIQSPITKQFLKKFFGEGLLSVDGDDHKRQRKALTPAFSIAAIRRMTSVFYDSAYKAKTMWDSMIADSPLPDGAVIDVQMWMNRIALDSIGIAGFSHDFHSLDGKPNAIVECFDGLGSRSPSIISMFLFLLSAKFPLANNIPVARTRSFNLMSQTISKIAKELLDRSREEQKDVTSDTRAEDKSIIGLLLKAGNEKAELRMSQKEIQAQMNLLILAGYETTSISLTWALIELSRKPSIQTKLRDELTAFGNADPTMDQLANNLPYLDAVVHETLRTHPPLPETMRTTSKDDIIPLSTPLLLPTGQTVTNILIPKGMNVSAPIKLANLSPSFWGPDAREFKPERWLDGSLDDKSLKKNQLNGHRHLLSFSDGPRMCLGKQFALAEFKSVLTVLIRNYEFSFVDGVEPEIGRHTGILTRPKIEGAPPGPVFPLFVKRVD